MLLCFDGGGSKSRMLLADDNFNLVGESIGLGVNTTHTPITELRDNLQSCLSECLKDVSLSKTDNVVATFVGPVDELITLLDIYGCSVEVVSELHAALWAGALRTRGYITASGTGSFAAYVGSSDKDIFYLDGRGLLLGDNGSGAWIGQYALRAVAEHLDGVGEATALTARFKEHLGVRVATDIIRQLYEAPSYVRYMAALVPEVSRAACDGDKVAVSLLEKAGTLLAETTMHVVEKTNPADDEKICVLSGGVWKAHSALFDSYFQKMKEQRPDICIRKPYFEPVMAGVTRKLSLEKPQMPEDEQVEFLAERFPGYRLNTRQ